ncbi:MAG: riboflavin synthase subunit alpha [Myxococcota bacterium]
MFTGIVQGTAQVRSVRDAVGLRSLVLALPEGRAAGLVPGASVAVAGTCLTAVEIDGSEVRFDLIDETLARTTLGALAVGHRVNVERAARFGDEIGGHLLSGHVLEAATVVERRELDGNLALTIQVGPSAARYVLPKGFVAVDGVSLTVGEVRAGRFAVHLIPETRRVTTLDALRPGDRVNLEVDAATAAVVDTVERVLADRS